MKIRNSRAQFGLVAQTLHWLIAGLIVYQYVLAKSAEDASLFQELVILTRHKAVGITILTLAAIRLIWKLTNPRVEPSAGEPRHRRVLARATHAMMYALLFAQPVTGWIMSSAANVPVSYFGWFTLPSLVEPHETWVDVLVTIHGSLFNALFLIVLVHVSAALYHHFVLKDNVLKRMIPGLEAER